MTYSEFELDVDERNEYGQRHGVASLPEQRLLLTVRGRVAWIVHVLATALFVLKMLNESLLVLRDAGSLNHLDVIIFFPGFGKCSPNNP